MSTALQEIELRNVGPIAHARLPYLPDGGLVVLRGPQGAGKTITLGALESAASGKGRPPIKDGERSALVRAFGVEMIIAKSTQRVGEPEVVYLDGRLSVGDLVDPGIKSPDAADSHRIKALISLTGLKPSAELFYGLLPGGRDAFEKVISPAAAEGDDLVASAERIKREFESAARKEEDRAEHAEGRARGAREAAGGVDTTAEADGTKLQGELEAAIREESTLRSQAGTAQRATLIAKQARDALEDAEVGYSGPTLTQAQNDESRLKTSVDHAEAEVRKAEEALRKAQVVHTEARNQFSQAIAARKSAESHESTIAQWREQIAASIPAAPTQEQLAAASQRVVAAREANDHGVLIREARKHLTEAETHGETATKHRQQAMALREAAKGIDTVLSEAVAKTGSPLRVENARLVVAAAGGKKKMFAELSDGERWKLALDIAIDAIGEKGFIPIPQWAWGELQPANKKAIAAHLRERGVTGYTAEATDDEGLNAEVYN